MCHERLIRRMYHCYANSNAEEERSQEACTLVEKIMSSTHCKSSMICAATRVGRLSTELNSVHQIFGNVDLGYSWVAQSVSDVDVDEIMCQNLLQNFVRTMLNFQLSNGRTL